MQKGIQLNEVSFRYHNSPLILNNISLHIPQGSFCGICGLNGSGKTTLTLLLNGLIPHEFPGKLSGEVFIDGVNTQTHSVSYFAKKVGMVFQNPDFMLFNLTVADEIAFGLKNFKLDNQEKRISIALDMVGMKNFTQRDPHTLSWGEKQRVALACVLAIDTPYIVLDEPIAMLDYKWAMNFYQSLAEINKKTGKTIIAVEHDTDFILTYADKAVIIDQGSIMLQGTPKSVFSHKTQLRQIGIKTPQYLQ